MTGLEPVRRSTHAPQTCLSTSSSTLALISRGEPLVSQRQDILYQGCPPLSTKFAKKFEKFSNTENYYQNRRKSTLFRTLSPAFGGMKNCRPSGNSVGRQNFFCGDVTQASHALCPNPPIPPYGAGAGIWAVGFLSLRQATIKYFRGCRPTGKPRRLKRATGTFLRAGFRIHST